jgi:hypothetical protein
MWCIPEVTQEFVNRMEHILDLYAKPYNPLEPIVCVDEKSKQLIENTRKSKPMKAGKPKRTDYEYQRNGTQNIFMAVEPKAGFRKAKVTKYRKCPDFAQFIKELTNLNRYRKISKLHIVLDNLNTHFEKSFYKTFSKMEADNILKEIEFHYTPKHASWLDMAEIEIGIMDRQCLGKRIPDKKSLVKNISVWQRDRNKQQAKINWKFTKQEARKVFKYQPAKLS